MAVATANGLRFEFDTYGAVAAPPLLLVQGLGMPAAMWPDAFIETLVAEGLRVITFDNRDCGGSSRLDAAGMPSIPRCDGACIAAPARHCALHARRHGGRRGRGAGCSRRRARPRCGRVDGGHDRASPRGTACAADRHAHVDHVVDRQSATGHRARQGRGPCARCCAGHPAIRRSSRRSRTCSSSSE